MTDPYKILGIAPGATDDEVKKLPTVMDNEEKQLKALDGKTVFMLTNSDRFCALYFVTKGDFFGETVGIFVHLLDKLGLDREAQLYSWKSEY